MSGEGEGSAAPAQLRWTARYLRYHYPGAAECDSLDEAVGYLAWGEEAGTLAGIEIVAPDGTVVLKGDELDRSIADRLR